MKLHEQLMQMFLAQEGSTHVCDTVDPELYGLIYKIFTGYNATCLYQGNSIPLSSLFIILSLVLFLIIFLYI